MIEMLVGCGAADFWPSTIESMDQSGKFSSVLSTPTLKAKTFIAPFGEFTTNLPMPSLNSNIRQSPLIKRNKR